MNQKLVIKQVYHNRCVVIPTEHLVMAGIEKGDYVRLEAYGDSISISKARLIGDETHDEAKVENLLAQIPHMTAAQLGAVGRACANQFEVLEKSWLE